jgi:hypothetical protein
MNIVQLLRLLVVVVTVTIASTVVTHAQTTLVSHVIASGGTINASNGQPNSFLNATIGQPIISGEITSETISRWEGFWVPAYYNPTSVDEEISIVAGDVHVYPNPMRETARLTFDTKLDGMVTLRMYDAVGVLVQTITREVSVAGGQSIPLTVISDSGEPMASGAYLCIIDGTAEGGKPYHASVRVSVVK